MHPIASGGVAWSVGMSVCDYREPCKNCWTYRDAIWRVSRVGSKELCTTLGLDSPYEKKRFWRDDVRIRKPQSTRSQWSWRRDFPACCRPAFWLAGHRSSQVSLNFCNEKLFRDAASRQKPWRLVLLMHET